MRSYPGRVAVVLILAGLAAVVGGLAPAAGAETVPSVTVDHGQLQQGMTVAFAGRCPDGYAAQIQLRVGEWVAMTGAPLGADGIHRGRLVVPRHPAFSGAAIAALVCGAGPGVEASVPVEIVPEAEVAPAQVSVTPNPAWVGHGATVRGRCPAGSTAAVVSIEDFWGSGYYPNRTVTPDGAGAFSADLSVPPLRGAVSDGPAVGIVFCLGPAAARGVSGVVLTQGPTLTLPDAVSIGVESPVGVTCPVPAVTAEVVILGYGSTLATLAIPLEERAGVPVGVGQILVSGPPGAASAVLTCRAADGSSVAVLTREVRVVDGPVPSWVPSPTASPSPEVQPKVTIARRGAAANPSVTPGGSGATPLPITGVGGGPGGGPGGVALTVLIGLALVVAGGLLLIVDRSVGKMRG